MLVAFKFTQYFPISDPAIRLLQIQANMIMHREISSVHGPTEKGEMSLVLSNCRRIWHDTHARLLAIRPKNLPQAQVKSLVIDKWESYGTAFNAKKGVNATTLNKPSELSDEMRYWKIHRRCFWGACACSINACHKMRVCTGCWRVLYCGEKCQRL